MRTHDGLLSCANGEDDLVRLGELPGAGRIVEQHAVAGARPGRQILVAVAGHVEEGVRRRQLPDVHALAGEIERDRVIAAPAIAASAITAPAVTAKTAIAAAAG